MENENKNIDIDMTQMNALIVKLAKADIPFRVEAFDCYGPTIIVCLLKQNVRVADAVCHFGSYGHQDGLMEVMAPYDYAEAHGWGDSVKGWLDADKVFEIFKDITDNYKGEG